MVEPDLAKDHDVRIFADPEELAKEVARELAEELASRLSAKPTVGLVLAGGSTPRGVYAALASPELVGVVDWSRVRVYFGDERAVGPDDPRSNFRMASEALLSHVPVAAPHVHRIRGEEPLAAAEEYERILRADAEEHAPVFDLLLLGLGEDGHTASLFPGRSAVHESKRWVVAEAVPALGETRITLTPVVLNTAESIVFLVAGAAKAAPLEKWLERGGDVSTFPSLAIAPASGRVAIRADRAALPGGARVR